MYLLHTRLRGIAPFGDIDVPFRTDTGDARLLTVIHGGAGVGKTSLLTAIACTRPGHAVVSSTLRTEVGASHPAHAWCEWSLGDDDLQRPHALTIASPHAPHDDDTAPLRRREQALFDRRAKDGGFVCVAFPSTRWFSRNAVSLHAPLRGVARYDPRTTTPLDDANRFDLARETKQALAYAEIAAALVPHDQRQRLLVKKRSEHWRDTRLLGTAMRDTTHTLVRLAGFGYEGLEPVSLEPRFSTPAGQPVTFDALPTRVRHLAAFSALTVRALWVAYPSEDPRTAQGVVVIDDVELRQESDVLAALVPTLRRCLPRVQWILSTASVELAATCSPDEVVALRRFPDDERVELFVGAQAQTH